METLLAFHEAGATSDDQRVVCVCVQRLLRQELEKFGLCFLPADTLPAAVTAAAASARVAILSGCAQGLLCSDGIAETVSRAVVEDAVKTALRIATLPLYRANTAFEAYEQVSELSETVVAPQSRTTALLRRLFP